MTSIFNRFLRSLTLLLPPLVILLGVLFRVNLLDQVGKDEVTFFQTVNSFISGNNPYFLTIRSFEDSDIYSSGYAYFPGLLYVYSILYVLAVAVRLPFTLLWKIPTLLSEIGVAITLLYILRQKPWFAKTVAVGVWMFNPYIVSQFKYTYNDPIAILFLLLCIYFIGKDDVLSGAFYGLSIAFKTFPVFVFPVVLLLAKNKAKFLTAGLLVGLVFSAPFLTSVKNATTYFKGALFVHQDRSIMGRPLLFFVSYYLRLEFIQLIPVRTYTYLASFSGWFMAIVLYFVKKIRDPYLLLTISFTCFYIFTPVFNRTYLLWFLPFLIIYSSLSTKALRTYVQLFVFYTLYFWYLSLWIDGFHIRKPF